MFNLVENDYTILGEYVNSQTKIAIKHNVCGYEYLIKPNNFIHLNRRCPRCKGGIQKSVEVFIEEIRAKYGSEYALLEDYINSRTPILVKHKCGYEFKITPDNLIRYGGCSHCSNCAIPSTQEFCDRVKSMVGNEIKIIGEYINSRTPIEIRHNKCNRTSFISPDNLYKYQICSHCIESAEEVMIRLILQDFKIKFEQEKSFDGLVGLKGGKLRYDFYLPDINAIIEYDGEHHDKPRYGNYNKLKITQDHDKIKDKYAKDNNIRLLRIHYSELKNIKRLVMDFIEDKTEHSYAHGED